MVPTNQKDLNSDSNLSHKNLDLNPGDLTLVRSQDLGRGGGIMHGRPTILMMAGQNGTRFMGIWSQ